MKTVTKTALANVKQNKGRNFLCGCAIALTTFLIFVVLTVGYGMIRVQLASVDAYYPTYDGIDAMKFYDKSAVAKFEKNRKTQDRCR